jgi:hypothetical protein
VNEEPLPENPDFEGIEYRFPADYTEGEKPAGLCLDGEWGLETLSNGREIRWRVVFYKETIDDEELRGIAVFSQGKLAQRPFFFSLSGGLSGQHGQQYISGQVDADYVDELTEDIIAPERQRINWEHKETAPLEEWGQSRLQQLLRLWRDRRGEKRRRQIEEKVAAFSNRLEKLSSSEQRTIKGALKKLGAIPTLSDEQFRSLGEAVLQAWEQGRLRNLIDDLARREDVTPDWLLSTLAEADVLVALNLAEAVRAKLEGVRMLRTLVDRGELENKVRDYIAERPYLLDPKWDTYKKETSVKGILEAAAQTAELNDLGEGGGKRLDLALRSNEDLLVVEFMRPGLKADWDHLQRCLRYVTLIREKIAAQTALGIRRITGLIVADRLDDDPSVRGGLKTLTKDDIHAFDWRSLLANAERTLAEYLDIVGERAPDDERLQSLKNHSRTGSEDRAQGEIPAGANND